VIDGIGIERAVKRAGAIVGDGTEHWRGGVAAMAGERYIFLDQLLCRHMHGNEADLAALAMHPEMHHASTAVQVAQAQPAEFLAADAVIEQGGEDGAIAHTLERVLGRRIEQLAGLGIAERRGRAFVSIGGRAFDTVDRIAGDSVMLAEIIEQGRERRELAANSGIGQAAGLKMLASGDDVGARHGAELGRTAQAGKGTKLTRVMGLDRVSEL
jgi:hypothetical protein